MTPKSRDEIREICQAFTDGLRDILGDKLFSVIVYGAAAFPDSLPTGDIDFHVILAGPLTGGERAALEELHASLAGAFPPLSGEMDGYYILLEDARQARPPKSQMWQGATDNSWALHRAHIRAGRCINLYGPDPAQIYPPVSWPELEDALEGELAYVEKHLTEYPAYCILNLCRLIYSFATGDVVVSKAAAAEWAARALPQWSAIIDLARKSYAGQASQQEQNVMLAEVEGLFRYACQRIEEGRRGTRR